MLNPNDHHRDLHRTTCGCARTLAPSSPKMFSATTPPVPIWFCLAIQWLMVGQVGQHYSSVWWVFCEGSSTSLWNMCMTRMTMANLIPPHREFSRPKSWSLRFLSHSLLIVSINLHLAIRDPIQKTLGRSSSEQNRAAIELWIGHVGNRTLAAIRGTNLSRPLRFVSFLLLGSEKHLN